MLQSMGLQGVRHDLVSEQEQQQNVSQDSASSQSSPLLSFTRSLWLPPSRTLMMTVTGGHCCLWPQAPGPPSYRHSTLRPVQQP